METGKKDNVKKRYTHHLMERIIKQSCKNRFLIMIDGKLLQENEKSRQKYKTPTRARKSRQKHKTPTRARKIPAKIQKPPAKTRIRGAAVAFRPIL
ncbi:MAG: hypothetical protein IJH71_04665 [Eubacterium sp.]|nr:hypothetical protein [Eubacterium sp.]